jgi:rhodanese-related sulfurtransferase
MTKEEFQNLDKDSILLIDIREADELAVAPSPVPATHMPMGKVFVEVAKGNLPKDKPVISLCQSGGRCKIVTDKLNEMGYQADYIEGGLNGLLE